MWYAGGMDTTYATVVGDRGRLVVPSVLRRSQDWRQGTQLLLLETPYGVLAMTRSQAKDLVKRQIGAGSLVAELLAERREIAGKEAS
ncbi:AbrB/MazE/SpoVT family DNA-binding domain-containing protein [Mobiluncus mulieris]|uniref:AbrB/MazE/SpoVT family DNA-binding domain-containing protein n=2 Tax=Mobiluncus mulieris TaxID=2052 RepID=A0A378PC65_9ACTO|nr:AbrB/MazE/SpoVT family DNA-binding domain-containing protein [Mobiluncus mulieris]NMX03265.1 AbrB/MazE/SpoVT family DNA-binding domain-containing protein [Mobiluncus mulieris]STO15903.1 Uncharacterised protein [Mobiluncus mulieris]STY84149.1 Uncharacterised protein [Mobiluncus mulieris]